MQGELSFFTQKPSVLVLVQGPDASVVDPAVTPKLRPFQKVPGFMCLSAAACAYKNMRRPPENLRSQAPKQFREYPNPKIQNALSIAL